MCRSSTASKADLLKSSRPTRQRKTKEMQAKARLLLHAMGIADSVLQGDPRWS